MATLADIKLLAYPVGCYIETNTSTNPSAELGGEWEQITGRFLYGDTSNTTDVSATTQTLSVANIPSHSHAYNHYHFGSNHSHNFSNTITHRHKAMVYNHSHELYISTKSTLGYHTHTFPTSSMPKVWETTTYNNSNPGGVSTLQYHHSGFNAQVTTGDNQPAPGSNTSDRESLYGAMYGSGPSWNTDYYEGLTDSASGTTASTGSGSSFSVMPPYRGCYTWKRIA